MEFSEEDESRKSEWEEVVRGSRVMKVSSFRRKKNDSGGMESEGRKGEEKDPKAWISKRTGEI